MADGGCADSTCTDAIDGCFTCQPTCYSRQSFCMKKQKATDYANHSWPEEFKKDQIIYNVLHRDVFNTAFTFINTALHKGNTPTSTWSGTLETRDFIYADKVKELLEGLNKFENKHSIAAPNPGDLITAKFFSDISDALNKAKIDYDACDNCNTECNVTCKSCQGCVNCQGCNTCQGHTTCHSPCHTPCDTPEGGDGGGSE